MYTNYLRLLYTKKDVLNDVYKNTMLKMNNMTVDVRVEDKDKR